MRAQVIKQMNKLINVLQATDLTDVPAVCRELVLLRVRAAISNRTAILKEAEIFGARVVDSSTEGFALEATGDGREAGRVYRHDAQLRRDRSDPVGHGCGVAGSEETAPVAAGAQGACGRRARGSAGTGKESNNIGTNTHNGKTVLRKRRQPRPLQGQDGSDYRLWQPGPRARAESAR